MVPFAHTYHTTIIIDLASDFETLFGKKLRATFLFSFPSICANDECCRWTLFWTTSDSSLRRDLERLRSEGRRVRGARREARPRPRPSICGRVLENFGSPSHDLAWRPPFAAGPSADRLKRWYRMDMIKSCRLLPSSSSPPSPSHTYTLTHRCCLKLTGGATTCDQVRVCRVILKSFPSLPLLLPNGHGSYDHCRARSTRSVPAQTRQQQ